MLYFCFVDNLLNPKSNLDGCLTESFIISALEKKCYELSISGKHGEIRKFITFTAELEDDKQQGFALVWIASSASFPSFNYNKIKISCIKWKTFCSRQAHISVRSAFLNAILSKWNAIVELDPQMHELNSNSVKFYGRLGLVFESWKKTKEFIHRIIDPPCQFIVRIDESDLLISSQMEEDEFYFSAFCLMAKDEKIFVEMDVNLTDKSNLPAEDKRMLMILKEEIRNVILEKKPQTFNLLHDCILYFPEGRRANHFLSLDEDEPLVEMVEKRLDIIVKEARESFQKKREKVIESLPFEVLRKASDVLKIGGGEEANIDEFLKCVESQLDVADPEYILFAYSKLVKRLSKPDGAAEDAESESFVRCHLASILLDNLLPKDLVCHREYSDPYSMFSRQVEKKVDAVVVSPSNKYDVIFLQEEKREFVSSNLAEEVTISNYDGRSADLVKLSRLLKASANRYEIDENVPLTILDESLNMRGGDSYVGHRNSNKAAFGSLLWGGSASSGYAFYHMEFLLDDFAVLVEVTRKDKLLDDGCSNDREAAYLAIVDYLAGIAHMKESSQKMRRMSEDKFARVLVGDPKFTPSLFKNKSSAAGNNEDNTSPVRKGISSLSMGRTGLALNPEDCFSVCEELCQDSFYRYTTHYLAKCIADESYVILRTKRASVEASERLLRSYVELAYAPHILPLITYFWKESEFANIEKQLVTVHPLCYPIFSRQGKVLYPRKLAFEDGLAILVAGLEFTHALQSHPNAYMHLDINPTNVLVKTLEKNTMERSFIQPEDVIFCDFDTLRSGRYDGPIREICGTARFTHPNIDRLAGGNCEAICPEGIEDIYSLAKTVRFFLRHSQDSGMIEALDEFPDLEALLWEMEHCNDPPDILAMLERAKIILSKA